VQQNSAKKSGKIGEKIVKIIFGVGWRNRGAGSAARGLRAGKCVGKIGRKNWRGVRGIARGNPWGAAWSRNFGRNLLGFCGGGGREFLRIFGNRGGRGRGRGVFGVGGCGRSGAARRRRGGKCWSGFGGRAGRRGKSVGVRAAGVGRGRAGLRRTGVRVPGRAGKSARKIPCWGGGTRRSTEKIRGKIRISRGSWWGGRRGRAGFGLRGRRGGNW